MKCGGYFAERMRGVSFRSIKWIFLILVFLTFCSGQCSSKQKVTEESATSFVAAEKEEQAGVKSQEAADVSGETEGEPGGEEPGEPPGALPEDAFVLAAAGDIIMHGRVKSAAEHQAASPSEEEDSKHEGWWRVFKHLKPVLDKSHIAVANLETPIAKERKKPSGRPPVLNGPPDSLGAAKEAGFDIMNIANNHAFDQMRDGVAETVDAIKEAGMEAVGGGHSRQEAETPLIKEAGGIKAAFLGWSIVLNKNFNDVKTKHKPWVNVYKETVALGNIKSVRPVVDLVVVNMHWGGEFDMKFGAKPKIIAKKLCEAGADIIIGHGPHVLHKVDVIESQGEEGRKCLVAYSLGNLLSNQGLKYRYGWKPPNLIEAKNIPYTRDGIILRVTVSRKENAVAFDKIEAVPVWTENNWIERYIQKKVPPDDIFIMPVISFMKAILEKNKKKLLLEERLEAIKKMVGDVVTYVEL